MKKQRVILDAELDRSVIRGTLTAPTGNRREFHGWRELNTALEAMLDTTPIVRPRAAQLDRRESRVRRPTNGHGRGIHDPK